MRFGTKPISVINHAVQQYRNAKTGDTEHHHRSDRYKRTQCRDEVDEIAECCAPERWVFEARVESKRDKPDDYVCWNCGHRGNAKYYAGQTGYAITAPEPGER